MKKILLFFVISTAALAQTDSSLIITNVVEITATKNDLFQRAIVWSSSAFKNGKSEIDYQDAATGKLIVRGFVHTPIKVMGVNYDAGWVYGTYTIIVKDNKYKYTFENFQHEIPKGTLGQWRDMGPLYGAEVKRSAGFGKRPDAVEWKKIKLKAEDEIKALEKSLVAAMAKNDSDF